jgi:hypothetical protein
MTIGANYPTPVMVNGFLCKNCTDVDYAKKHIDPAHPRSGPYGIDAKNDPSVKQSSSSASVTFGGALSALNSKPATSALQPSSGPASQAVLAQDGATPIGSQVDLSA